MSDQMDPEGIPRDLGSSHLAQAIKNKIDAMSDRERAALWWSSEGNRLVNTLRGQEGRQPSFLEILACETGDLTVRDDGFFETTKEFADYLMRASMVWPMAFDLARRICIRNLSEGRLQSSLQLLAALILSGEMSKPRSKSGRASKNWYRDLLIVRGVSSTAKYGLNPTRNDASGAGSGCDLVVEAFNRAGRRDAPTYQAVRKVWDQRDALLKDYEEIDLAKFARNVSD